MTRDEDHLRSHGWTLEETPPHRYDVYIAQYFVRYNFWTHATLSDGKPIPEWMAIMRQDNEDRKTEDRNTERRFNCEIVSGDRVIAPCVKCGKYCFAGVHMVNRLEVEIELYCAACCLICSGSKPE